MIGFKKPKGYHWKLDELGFLDRSVKIGDLFEDMTGNVYLIQSLGTLCETQEEAVIFTKVIDNRGEYIPWGGEIKVMTLERFLAEVDWKKHPDPPQPYYYQKITER